MHVCLVRVLTTQPAAKKAATTKKPLATKANLPNESISEDDDFSIDDTPAKPKAVIDAVEDDVLPKGPAKSASEMYQKVSVRSDQLGLVPNTPRSSRNSSTS